MNPKYSSIRLDIFDVTVFIKGPQEINDWIKHDYRRYVADNSNKVADLTFNLSVGPANLEPCEGLVAKSYHKDYIIYEQKNLRVIDFFGEALSVFNKKTKETSIYCPDQSYLYEIFYLAFESLVGESLEKKGYTRIHCLALEKDEKASILMLPPGGGKTTLALKFLKHPAIRVLTEDILLYKKGKFYGLNFRWGIRTQNNAGFKKRLMKRREEHDKYLFDTEGLPLAQEATYGKVLIGIRQLNNNCLIKPVSKSFIFFRMLKPLVLGLELQQSLAYFLLGGLIDFILKLELITKRLKAMAKISFHSKGYKIFLGNDPEKNYKILTEFLNES